MTSNCKPTERRIEIGLLLYPDVQLAAVYGLTDLFSIANQIRLGHGRLNSEPLLDTKEFRVSHWAFADERAYRPTRVFSSHAPPDGGGENLLKLEMLILPPSLSEPISVKRAAQLRPWIVQKHSEGSTICSVCAGAFLLAETGLLKSRVVTTHWTYANQLAQRFPEIVLDRERLVIDDGDIMTAGGLMAWTDLGLKIIERYFGAEVMLATARFMVVDIPDREQRFYGDFAPILNHGDRSILKVQHWLQVRGGAGCSLLAMAKEAELKPRTFIRRFFKATGLNPTEYCQRLKINKARDLLETSSETIEKVAWTSGYEDPSSFRKTFQKIVGLTPAEFRKRFSVASKLKSAPHALPQ